MNILYLFLVLLLGDFLYSFRRPVYALVGFLSVLVWENTLVENYGVSGSIIQLSGVLMGVVFVVNHLVTPGKYPIKLSAFHLWFFIFILYIIVRSPGLAFGLEGQMRNWVSTYVQLLVFTIIAPSLISSKKDLRVVMNGLITAITIFGIWFLFIAQESLNIQEADFSSANSHARYLAISILFTIFLLYEEKKYRKRVLIFILLIFQSILLIYTGSRTMIVLVGTLMGFIMIRVFGLNFKTIMAVGFLFMASIFILPAEVIQSFIQIFTGEAYEGGKGTKELQTLTGNIRFIFWKEGFNMMWDHSVLFGIGIGNFKIYITEYLPILDVGLDTHNTYLSVLFENGVIGFIIFLVFLKHTLKGYGLKLNPRSLFSRNAWPTGMFTIWQVYSLSLALVLIGSISKHDHYNKLFFLLLSLSVAIQFLRKRDFAAQF